MLRRMLSRFVGGGRRATTGPPAGRHTTPGSKGSTGDIERGVRSIFRGLTRRRRGA